MQQKQQDEYPLHIFVSNQSIAIAESDMKISIDGRQVFHREMMTGTQHNWEQVTIPVASGRYALLISETKTQTHKSEVVNIDRELWIVVTFHGPPAQFKVHIFDYPVAFM